MKKTSYKKVLVSAALAAFMLALLPVTPSLYLSASRTIFQGNGAGWTPSAPTLSLRLTPLSASAQSTGTNTASVGANPYACGLTTLQTCIPFFLFWLIDALGGLLIALGATLVGWLLAFNQLVFSSAMVQTGFSVCLAIANLGFVLGIIVIAIATILRDQTYGAKQLLWKLVVMAILINFGLVITRPIVGISDSFSNFFLKSISGTVNGATVSGGDGLGVALTGLMSPQTFLGNASATQGKVQSQLGSSPSDQFVADMMTMFFAGIIFGTMIIALMALAVLLFVRYVYLAMLLILLPFAWLMWVFPKFKGQFSEWWNNFIKWTFFPPVALFFMYLVILTLTTKAQGNAQQLQSIPQVSTTAGGGAGVIAGLQGSSNGNGASGAATVLQQGLDDLALAALMIGGLFAAQKMTGEIGSKTVSMAKSASGWATGKVGGLAARQGKRAATSMVPQKTMEKLQSGQLGGIGRIIPKRLQVAAGVGLSNVKKAGGSKLVDQESAWAKTHSEDPEEAKRLLASGGLTTYKRVALLKSMGAQGRLGDNVKVNGQSLSEYIDSDKDGFATLGQGKLTKDVDKALGSNRAMRDAARALKVANQGGDEAAKKAAADDLHEKSTAFYRDSDLSDVSKINANSVFGADSDPILARAQMKAIAETQPHVVPSILSKANGATRATIQKTYESVVEEAKGDAKRGPEYAAKQSGIVAKHTDAITKVNTSGSDEQKAVLAAAAPAIESAIKPDQDRINAEIAKAKDAVDFVRLSGGDLNAAQAEYNKKIAALQQEQLDLAKKRTEAEKKAVTDHISTLQKQREADEKALEEETSASVEARLGKKKIDQAFGSNAFFGVPMEQPPEPKPAETK